MPGPVFSLRPLEGSPQTILLWALGVISFNPSVSNMGVCNGEPPHQLAEPRHGSDAGDKQDLFLGPHLAQSSIPVCRLPEWSSLKPEAAFPTAPSHMSWLPGRLLSGD